MSYRDRLIALVEITRPTTSLGASLLALLGVRITLLNGSSDVGFWDAPRISGFAIGWFLLAQAAFAVNDAFDASIDAISHPARAIPAGRLRRRDAFIFGTALGGLGTVALALVSLPLGLVALLYGITSWVYSARLKVWNGLAANATVAGLIALVPLSVGGAGSSIEPVWWLVVPTFLGVLAREILNDIEDADGDRVAGRPTLPVMLGDRWAYCASAAIWIGFTLTAYVALALEPQLFSWAYIVAVTLLNMIVVAGAIALVQQRSELLAQLQLMTKLVLFAYVILILILLTLP